MKIHQENAQDLENIHHIGRRECPAKGAECRKCNKKGHNAAMCGTIVRYLDDEDDSVLGTATEEPMVCGAVNWHADVQVTTTTHSRSVNFRTDTGADVTVVPDRFFNKKSPLIQKTDKKLFGPGQSKIIVLGKVRATMAVGEVSTDQDLYVVADLKEPLLGRPINSVSWCFTPSQAVRLYQGDCEDLQLRH